MCNNWRLKKEKRKRVRLCLKCLSRSHIFQNYYLKTLHSLTLAIFQLQGLFLRCLHYVFWYNTNNNNHWAVLVLIPVCSRSKSSRQMLAHFSYKAKVMRPLLCGHILELLNYIQTYYLYPQCYKVPELH